MSEQMETMSDADRESAIAECFAAMQAPTCTSAERRLLFARFKALVAGRSAEAVRAIEEAKGLRPKAA